MSAPAEQIRHLDAAGHCCGMVPILFRRTPAYRLCPLCRRAFDARGGQVANAYWQVIEGGFGKIPAEALASCL